MNKELIKRAEGIRDEPGIGRNTAYRVGSFLSDFLAYVDRTYATKGQVLAKSVDYKDIDTVLGGGEYEVYDSDALQKDLMLVSAFGEGNVTVQLLLASNSSRATGAGLVMRVHDGERWGKWENVLSVLRDEAEARMKGDAVLEGAIGSEMSSVNGDGSVWGELKSLASEAEITSKAVDELESQIENGGSARFDRIVYNASIVIGGVTNETGGEVVFVPSKNRFAYLAGGKYYANWPDMRRFMSGDNKVIDDRVYLCENKAYVYYQGALLKTDEHAEMLALEADSRAKEALNALQGVWTVKSAMIDQLDELNNPVETYNYYSVYYQYRVVGTLRVFGNSTSSIVTQILDANWDVDEAGNLLDDYEAVEMKTFVRVYNVRCAGIAGEIPLNSWGKWKLNRNVIALGGGIVIE